MRYWPPSTTIACPVMNAASSLVKNRTAPVTSPGSSFLHPLNSLLFPGDASLFFRLWCGCQSEARQYRVRGDAIASNIVRQAPHKPDDPHFRRDVVAHA